MIQIMYRRSLVDHGRIRRPWRVGCLMLAERDGEGAILALGDDVVRFDRRAGSVGEDVIVCDHPKPVAFENCRLRPVHELMPARRTH